MTNNILSLLNEIKMYLKLQSLKHPNILLMEGAIIEKKNYYY